MGMTDIQTLEGEADTRVTQRTLDADVRRELRRGEIGSGQAVLPVAGGGLS